MTQQLFLGIDGGGSTCKARIGDRNGAALGEGHAGPANTRLGVAHAFGEIETAAREALRSAGLAGQRIADLIAGAGLAGLNLGVDRRAVERHPHPFARFTVDTDVHVACLGAFGGEDGAVLVIGTGSCGGAIIDGRSVSVGGWGFNVGDQASGASVGREALRCALLVDDGIVEPSALGEQIMQAFEGQAENLVTWADTARPVDYGRFAPTVVALAETGDSLATELLRGAGDDASRLARALLQRGAARLALAGGFAPALRPWLADDILAALVEPQGDGMDGALLLARRTTARAETTR